MMTFYDYLLAYLDTRPKDCPVWWQSLREKARAAFIAQGLPAQRWENYRYTPVDRLAKLFSCPLQQPEANIITPPDAGGPAIYLRNGELSHTEGLPEGIHVTALSKANPEDMAWAAQHVGSIAQATEDPWIAWNSAAFADCTLIRIAGNTTLRTPIFLYHQSEGSLKAPIVPSRVFLDIGEKSWVHFIEVAPSSGPALLLRNKVREINLQAHAHLTYHVWPAILGDSACQLNYTAVRQAEASGFSHYEVLCSGAFVRHHTATHLLGSQAWCTLYGATLSQADTHRETSIVVYHEAEATTSDTYYKSVAAGESTSVFHGTVYVRKEAQKTKASQYHHGWNVTDKAKIYTRPELFIEADDVICRHGATIAQEDPAAMFYLQARGIAYPAAKTMLLQAFVQDTLQTIEDGEIKRELKNKIRRQVALLSAALSGQAPMAGK